MLEGHRMILEGRVEIGLRGMPTVTRFRKKRQIRQFQVRDRPRHMLNPGGVGLVLQPGMDEHQAEQQQAHTEQGQGKARFSYRQSSLAPRLYDQSASQGF